jgi:hypothetical protein
MNDPGYYRDLLVKILNEDSDDDVPAPPSRKELAKNKLMRDHNIDLAKLPWITGLDVQNNELIWQITLDTPLPIGKDMWLKGLRYGSLFNPEPVTADNAGDLLTFMVGPTPFVETSWFQKHELEIMSKILEKLGFKNTTCKVLGGGSSLSDGMLEYVCTGIGQEISDVAQKIGIPNIKALKDN